MLSKYPHTTIVSASVELLNAPLIQHFRTALGDHRRLENVLFKLRLASGVEGLGEAAVATHITGETIEETQKKLKKIGARLEGQSVDDYIFISSMLHEALPNNKAALAAVEMAVLDAYTQAKKIPLWKLFGKKLKAITTDVTIVIGDLEETQSSAIKFYKQGFRAFKVKIGRDEALDLKRVAAVYQLTKKSAIYLDANQGYNADQMIKFVQALDKLGIKPALLEQPVVRGDWEGLKRITKRFKIPVCADESVKTLEDARYAIKTKSVSAINIKLMKSGIVEGEKIARLARRAGIQLMIGGMLETSLAMTASAHLACGLGYFDYVDLDTPFFIKDDLKHNPYLNARGQYRLSKTKPGIGIKLLGAHD